MITYAYLKYAMALLMEENELSEESAVTFDHIKREIAKGLECFCVKPIESYEGKDEVKFGFVNEQNKALQFVFLSPNVVAKEMNASNLYNAAKHICEMTSNLSLEERNKVTQSQIPTAGEFCSFSDSGNIGRGKPEASNLSICLGLITSTSSLKPCLYNIPSGNGQNSPENVCLIPDLEIPQLVDFVRLFKKLRLQKLSNLMVGKVEFETKTNTYKPKRPKIFSGNFPNAPRSSALGSIALLGAIGEMVKEKEVSGLACRVLDSFKGHNFYAFKYGDAQIFSFNNYIIELAKESHLRSVVDAVYYISLYSQGARGKGNLSDYQKLDLFTSRFLQLFNRPAFKDFLSFRAEYPKELETLLKTYFIHMEHISEEIVRSAKELGRWLNLVAYRVAKAEIIKEDVEIDDNEKLRKAKAKVLVELESSIFASKSADALIAHTIARAGRLSATDAPADASLFIEKTVSGELSLEQAKNLLIAFSRLKSTASKKTGADDENIGNSSTEETDLDISKIDYSNI